MLKLSLWTAQTLGTWSLVVANSTSVCFCLHYSGTRAAGRPVQGGAFVGRCWLAEARLSVRGWREVSFHCPVQWPPQPQLPQPQQDYILEADTKCNTNEACTSEREIRSCDWKCRLQCIIMISWSLSTAHRFWAQSVGKAVLKRLENAENTNIWILLLLPCIFFCDIGSHFPLVCRLERCLTFSSLTNDCQSQHAQSTTLV